MSKSGQNLATLQARVEWHLFWLTVTNGPFVRHQSSKHNLNASLSSAELQQVFARETVSIYDDCLPQTTQKPQLKDPSYLKTTIRSQRSIPRRWRRREQGERVPSRFWSGSRTRYTPFQFLLLGKYTAMYLSNAFLLRLRCTTFDFSSMERRHEPGLTSSHNAAILLQQATRWHELQLD